MNDVRPERAWFEKAGQDLEMACRALGDKDPENSEILSIQIQTSVGMKYNR